MQYTGKWFSEDTFINYKADSAMPLPMIFQSGYLTIKDVDRDFNTYLLDFPNREVPFALQIENPNTHYVGIANPGERQITTSGDKNSKHFGNIVKRRGCRAVFSVCLHLIVRAMKMKHEI